MKVSKSNLITYSIIAVASILAIYFFFQTKELKEELAESRDMEQSSAISVSYQSLEAGDSLLAVGNYQEALEEYQVQYRKSNDPIVAQRMKMVRQVLKDTQGILNQSDSIMQPVTDTVQLRRYATPEEVRHYDSLSFAVAKARAQIENLKRQLEQRKSGSYLTFTTTKGNKAHYVGEQKNGQAHGRGVALLNTGSRYEGEWKNNMRHGKGIFYWPDGEYYDGDYQNDKRHGQGAYYWPNGDKYVGGWANDHRSGQGTFYNEDGEVVAKGIWKSDELVKVDKN